ncbi:MAG: ParD-like family protein [Sphingopyxis sp.]|nr:ParD-like family protein [Sphingopyxis sp.]
MAHQCPGKHSTRASAAMCRSIYAQAEFWMKIGRLAAASPTLSFNEIISHQLASVHVPVHETRKFPDRVRVRIPKIPRRDTGTITRIVSI